MQSKTSASFQGIRKGFGNINSKREKSDKVLNLKVEKIGEAHTKAGSHDVICTDPVYGFKN